MTKHYYNIGTRLYNKVNSKEWVVFYAEFDTELDQWVYLMVLADSKNFLVLGKDNVVTGYYIANKIKEGKIIMNYVK